MENSFLSKLLKPSARGRTRWIFILIVAFALVSLLVAGGNFYNQSADWLAEKTNHTINLPHTAELPFRLGLDLQGGTHLVYEADVSSISDGNQGESLEGVRDVIERRINVFGVSEPVVQVNRSASGAYRLIVELAGIKDVDEAISMIGETPLLEFKERSEIVATPEISNIEINPNDTSTPVVNIQDEIADYDNWQNTTLSGRYLKRAVVQFDPNDSTPQVSLEFDSEGANLFEEITERNIGKPIAIFLDGFIISAPNVNERISGGQAVISGRFTMEEAKLLTQRLNAGALPVSIELVSQKTVGASLGQHSIDASLAAALFGLLLVVLFMLIVYRVPGFWAVISLIIYGMATLAVFKAMPVWIALLFVVIIIGLMIYTFHDLKVFDSILSVLLIVIGIFLFIYALKPITLTLSGLAGFILSIGMAVDANVLIFERLKEEIKLGKSLGQAIDEAFKKAWPSIRDGNISTIFICLVLMFFGTGSIQGFGTTLFIGISISMFSAIVITRTWLLLIKSKGLAKRPWLMGVNHKVNK